MIRPIPRQHPGTLPSARRCPDPQHIEDLSRLGDEITEMAAHLTAGTCQLLELIAIFDEEGGWQWPRYCLLCELAELEMRHEHGHRP